MENDFIPMLELDEDVQLENTEDNDGEFVIKEEEEIEGEEKEEEEEGIEDDTPEEEEEEEEEGSNDVTEVEAVYKIFTSKSYIPESKSPPKSWEELDEMIDNIPAVIADSLVASLPEDSQLLIDYVLNNEKLTRESLLDFVGRYAETLDSDDFTEDDAKTYLSKVYKDKGLSDKVIQTTLETLEDDGELLTEAQSLKAQDKQAALQSLEAEKEQEKANKIKRADDAKKYWIGVGETLKAKNWQPKKQGEVLDFLKNQGPTKTLNEIYKSPKALVELANILTTFDPKTQSFNLSFKEKQTDSKVVKEIQNNIIRDTFSTAIKSKTGSKVKTGLENYEVIID
jgi:hypothetical protein